MDGRFSKRQPDKRRAGLEWFGIVIRRGEKPDEVSQRFRRALSDVNEALPFQQWRGMNTAQSEPSVAIGKRDGEILRVLRDVESNALPANRAVLATKVVVICRHREATMARRTGKARPAGSGFTAGLVADDGVSERLSIPLAQCIANRLQAALGKGEPVETPRLTGRTRIEKKPVSKCIGGDIAYGHEAERGQIRRGFDGMRPVRSADAPKLDRTSGETGDGGDLSR